MVALLATAVGGWWLSRDASIEARLLLVGAWILLACILARNGIIHLLGPVFFFELLRGSRRRIHLHRVLYATILFGSISYLYLIGYGDRDPDSLATHAEMARTFFLLFFGIQMLAIGLLTPVMVAGCITEEKERRTLEFVLATDLRGREIVLGKLAARVAGMLLILMTGLPILVSLQFFGGILPEEILGAMFISLVTLFSVAALSIASSVLLQRSRDAILSVFAAILGYLVLSGALEPVRYSQFGRAGITIGRWTVENYAVIDFIQAGNPFRQVVALVNLQDAGAAYGESLRERVIAYAVFHGLIMFACLGWALFRLRPLALAQGNGGRPRRTRRRRLPVIGDSPMLWKEIFTERGVRLHVLLRLAILLIVMASFLPPAFSFYRYIHKARPDWGDLAAVPFIDAWNRSVGFELYDLQYEVNEWIRITFALVGSLMLIAVSMRAAGSITGERARQTLDDLLTTPLTNLEIVSAKWIGSLLGNRRGFYWMGGIFLVGLVMGGVDLLGIAAAVFAWCAYAVFFASIGLWYSSFERNTFRATTGTFLVSIIALGGHWLFTALFCCLPLGSGTRELSDILPAAGGFLVGFTPPVVFGFTPIRALSELEHINSELKIGLFFGLWGPLIMLALGFAIRSATVGRFAETHNRTTVQGPERHNPHATSTDLADGTSGIGATSPSQSQTSDLHDRSTRAAGE
jgi:ABC-type transport system involved in multi-copper enzyme maturation permease subunit